VACAQQAQKALCVLSQQQSDKDSRQLVVAIELRANSADKAEGTLVLPSASLSLGR
jgi:invasion protein IalB